MNIYKYAIHIADFQTILIAKDAKILSAQMQNDQLCVWTLEDSRSPTEQRGIWIFGTGHHLNGKFEDWKHLGTVQQDEFVWHVFERVGE